MVKHLPLGSISYLTSWNTYSILVFPIKYGPYLTAVVQIFVSLPWQRPYPTSMKPKGLEGGPETNCLYFAFAVFLLLPIEVVNNNQNAYGLLV